MIRARFSVHTKAERMRQAEIFIRTKRYRKEMLEEISAMLELKIFEQILQDQIRSELHRPNHIFHQLRGRNNTEPSVVCLSLLAIASLDVLCCSANLYPIKELQASHIMYHS